MYKFEFLSLTQLGEIFGVSNQQVGKWLVHIGLRTSNKKPSREAFENGYVQQMPSRNDGYTWSWHAEKTVTALESAGHFRVANPPPALMQPPRLKGPFSIRSLDDRIHQIVSADGSVPIIVTGGRNARFVQWLLDLAERNGIIEQRLGEQVV